MGGCAGRRLFTQKSCGREDTSSTKDLQVKQGAFILFFITSYNSPKGQWEELGLRGQQIIRRTECATFSSLTSFAFFFFFNL